MSFGRFGKGSDSMQKQLDILGRYMFLVGTAGNRNNGNASYFPACHPLVTAVGSHDIDGSRSTFSTGAKSSYQPYVLISAPGTSVWTTDMIGKTENGLYYKGYYDPDGPIPDVGECYWFEGTSASAPIVSGIAAMTLGMNPGLTPAQLAQRLQDTKRKPMLQPWDWGSGMDMGMVDAYSAVTGVTP